MLSYYHWGLYHIVWDTFIKWTVVDGVTVDSILSEEEAGDIGWTTLVFHTPLVLANLMFDDVFDVGEARCRMRVIPSLNVRVVPLRDNEIQWGSAITVDEYILEVRDAIWI